MSRESIRARVAAAHPRCQYLLGGEVRCGLLEPMHVPNVTDHPFLFIRSLDGSPEADITALLAVADAAAVAIYGLLSTGWLMDSLTSEEGWPGTPNRMQWLYDAIVAAGRALDALEALP